MAIVVEEEKRGFGILTFIIWLAIIGVIGFGAYYIFFIQPEVVDIVFPSSLSNLSDLSENIDALRPELIESDPVFNSLKRWVTTPISPEVGRSNPFLSF